MSNRNQVEYVGIILNLKERQTSKGWMYTFSIPINGQANETAQELTEWIDTVIFTRERMALTDRGEAHFTAKLEVKPGYENRGPKIGLVGKFIEPVFGNVYRISKKKNRPQPDK